MLLTTAPRGRGRNELWLPLSLELNLELNELISPRNGALTCYRRVIAVPTLAFGNSSQTHDEVTAHNKDGRGIAAERPVLCRR